MLVTIAAGQCTLTIDDGYIWSISRCGAVMIMSVINTRRWLEEFVAKCEKGSSFQAESYQRQTLIKRLINYFPDLDASTLQGQLQEYGLFQPREWKKMKKIGKALEKERTLELAQKEFRRLQNEWQGPDVPIFIFPITRAEADEERVSTNKSGVAYDHIIFLFVSPGLPRESLYALLAHEYNHVCRLQHLGISPRDLTLKELVVLEGMGEYAVKEQYGDKWLAPWSSMYTVKEAKQSWKRLFVDDLQLDDRKKHNLYMLGKTWSRYPKWIGYNVGFHIVQSYAKANGTIKGKELYKKSADEVIKGSGFSK
ncbi:DUF2268 domain-containing protein [Pontibacillus salicampi]|uniref:DUF2268 domain-containing protein n=1 Tax=Pontibacillus salicampi TaxID=1449801 RepID=A0ABV6LN14_9BACI